MTGRRPGLAVAIVTGGAAVGLLLPPALVSGHAASLEVDAGVVQVFTFAVAPPPPSAPQAFSELPGIGSDPGPERRTGRPDAVGPGLATPAPTRPAPVAPATAGGATKGDVPPTADPPPADRAEETPASSSDEVEAPVPALPENPTPDSDPSTATEPSPTL